jgi:hypothetical protein
MVEAEPEEWWEGDPDEVIARVARETRVWECLLWRAMVPLAIQLPSEVKAQRMVDTTGNLKAQLAWRLATEVWVWWLDRREATPEELETRLRDILELFRGASALTCPELRSNLAMHLAAAVLADMAWDVPIPAEAPVWQSVPCRRASGPSGTSP